PAGGVIGWINGSATGHRCGIEISIVDKLQRRRPILDDEVHLDASLLQIFLIDGVGAFEACGIKQEIEFKTLTILDEDAVFISLRPSRLTQQGLCFGRIIGNWLEMR